MLPIIMDKKSIAFDEYIVLSPRTQAFYYVSCGGRPNRNTRKRAVCLLSDNNDCMYYGRHVNIDEIVKHRRGYGIVNINIGVPTRCALFKRPKGCADYFTPFNPIHLTKEDCVCS